LAEGGDLAVVPQIAIDRVIFDVTEDRVLPFAAPGRPFGEMKTGRHAVDHFLADQEIVEAGIDAKDVRIRRNRGLRPRTELARRVADDRAWNPQLRFSLRMRQGRDQGCAPGDHAAAGQSIRHVLIAPPEREPSAFARSWARWTFAPVREKVWLRGGWS